jgi:hypothetical protein
LLVLSVLALCSFADRPSPTHSVVKPFVTGRGGIRYWVYGAAAVVAEDYVRLTPAAGSKTGRLWNSVRMEMADWSVDMEFSIGGGGRLGADGLALWYAAESNSDGPVFGSKDEWTGIAIVVDTFDNDAARDNPEVAVLLNDGTQKYDAATEGAALRIGAGTNCKGAALRNTGRTSMLRVRYQASRLTVSLDPQNNGGWQQCVEAQIGLPRGYYIGVSAATGGLYDNHDVYGIATTDLTDGRDDGPLPPLHALPPPPPTPPVPGPPAQEEKQEKHEEKQEEAKTQLEGQTEQQNPEIKSLLDRLNRLQGKQAPIQPTPQEQQPPPAEAQPPTATATTPDPVPLTRNPLPDPQPAQAAQAAQAQAQAMNEELRTQVAQMTRSMQLATTSLMQVLRTVEAMQTAIDTMARAQQESDRLRDRQTTALEATIKESLAQAAQSQQQAVLELRSAVSTRAQGAATEAITAAGAVRGQVDSIQKEVAKLNERIESTAERTISHIETRTSYGFWFFLLIFQVLFFAAFVVWRHMRDDNDKKLL